MKAASSSAETTRAVVSEQNMLANLYLQAKYYYEGSKVLFAEPCGLSEQASKVTSFMLLQSSVRFGCALYSATPGVENNSQRCVEILRELKQPVAANTLENDIVKIIANSEQEANQRFALEAAYRLLLRTPPESSPAERRKGWLRILRWVAAMSLTVALGLAISNSLRPKNIALHKFIVTSSRWPGENVDPRAATDGNKDSIGFVTKEENEPWVYVDLGEEHIIHAARAFNRSELLDRAVPLVVQVSSDLSNWQEVARTEYVFRVWHPRFSAVKGRYVRFVAPHRTFLHLNEIEVYLSS